MSRHFVPVTDQERPRTEQDPHDDSFRKHRQFDNPFQNRGDAKKPGKAVDRGWEAGSVGWGVRGYFGDNQADTGAHIKPQSREGLVQDHMGRWVKPKYAKQQRQDGKLKAGPGDGAAPADALEAEQGAEEAVEESREPAAESDGRGRRGSPRPRSPRERRPRSRSPRRRSRSPARQPSSSSQHPTDRARRSRSPEGSRSRRRSRSGSPRADARSRRRSNSPSSRERHRRRSRSRSRSPQRDRHRRSRSRSRSRSPPRPAPRGSSGRAPDDKGGQAGKRWDPQWGWA